MLLSEGQLASCGSSLYSRGACSAERRGVLYHNQRLGIVLQICSDDSKSKNWTCKVDVGDGEPRTYPYEDVHPIAELPRDFRGTPQEAFAQFGPQVVADLNRRVEGAENKIEDLILEIDKLKKKKQKNE